MELTVALGGSTSSSGRGNTATVAMASGAVERVIDLVGELTSSRSRVGRGVRGVVESLTSATKLLLVQSCRVRTSLSSESLSVSDTGT